MRQSYNCISYCTLEKENQQLCTKYCDYDSPIINTLLMATFVQTTYNEIGGAV
jgi:hypothetical protein